MNTKNKNNIVMYQAKDGKVELRADIEKDTIWATQDQIAELFDRDKSVISKHLSNIFKEGELDAQATIAKNATVQKEGGREVVRDIEYYNLDAILSVGYRVSSRKATQFRIWATGILRKYLVEGYVINKHRLESSPESLVGLYQAITMLESMNKDGKLRGKITLKLTEEMVPSKPTYSD